MRARILWLTLVTAMAQGAQADPVASPNGTLVGHFGDVAFDHPILCEKAPFLTARTHDGRGMPAFEAAIIPSSMASIEIRSKAQSRQFGTSVGELDFPMLMEGDVDGIEFSFNVDCPAEFAQ